MALYLVTLTSSLCTMAYSMLMAGVMTEYTGEEVITQCLTMGPYLLGLGLGSAFGDKVRSESQLKVLWRLEWLSVALLPFIPLLQLVGTFLFINLVPHGVNLDSRLALWCLCGLTGVLAVGAGLLGGAQLPLLLKRIPSTQEERVLAVNYLGPLLAGVAIVQMNLHAVPLGVQIYAVGLVQLVGLVALVSLQAQRLRALTWLVFPIGLLFGAASLFQEAETLTVKSAYLGTKASLRELMDPRPLFQVLRHFGSVERTRTPYQTIDLVVEAPNAAFGFSGNASVYLNRKPQFDLYSADIYHQSMVQAGVNLLGHGSQNILVLGAGDGLLLSEFRQRRLESRITMVELDGKMLEWSRQHPLISKLNRNSLSDIPPNVDLRVGDGVSYLRRLSAQTYDLIFIDFPFPNGHELAKLYSLEFYQLVSRALAADGVVIIDLPLYLTVEGVLSFESRVILKTMREAGFVGALLFGPNASFVALSKSSSQLAFDYKKLPDGLKLASYLNLMTPFRFAEISAHEWAQVPVNTMFWPRGL